MMNYCRNAIYGVCTALVSGRNVNRRVCMGLVSGRNANRRVCAGLALGKAAMNGGSTFLDVAATKPTLSAQNLNHLNIN